MSVFLQGVIPALGLIGGIMGPLTAVMLIDRRGDS